MEKVYFAGGCFWGVEHYFQKLEGVESTSVGYMGGKTDNPTYDEICQKMSGHAEVVEVVYDESKVEFEDIAKLFFEIHDPTQLNRQGPDKGDQYRTEVFYTTDEQKNTSQKLIEILKSKDLDVVTKLTEASTYWIAEDYHQKYYEKNGSKPYCHIRQSKF